MNDRTITANLSYEVVQRIMEMQRENGIKFFADAVGAYIEYLERKARTVSVR